MLVISFAVIKGLLSLLSLPEALGTLIFLIQHPALVSTYYRNRYYYLSEVQKVRNYLGSLHSLSKAPQLTIYHLGMESNTFDFAIGNLRPNPRQPFLSRNLSVGKEAEKIGLATQLRSLTLKDSASPLTRRSFQPPEAQSHSSSTHPTPKSDQPYVSWIDDYFANYVGQIISRSEEDEESASLMPASQPTEFKPEAVVQEHKDIKRENI